MVAIACLTPTLTLAQTITPAPDGTGTAIEYQGQTYRITGGTQAGANLFHSFQQFGLNAGEIAQFLSQPGIENILGRVTGGNPSVIQGILQVSGSNAHLYLMNPAGIIFGPGSSLDLSGNFTATTGDRIGFAGGWFNAFGPNDYPALTGNPQQLSFLQNAPGSIINAGDLITSGNLYISAGTILNTGKIEGKHVILTAVPGQSLVQLAQPGMILRLEVDHSQVQGGITALDLPQLLTGSEITPPQDINPGEVIITNIVKGETVDLMATAQVIPTDPTLIRTGDGSNHNPTVVLFPENLDDPWAVNMIDSRVDQAHDLLYGGKAGTISQLILPEEEGVGAMNATLGRVTAPIDELNIIAEGNQSYLWLGQTWLNSENIGNYQAEIEQWGANLGPNAALFIYSCFTALGAIGEGFINTLADLTGATVAASTNATGSANYGGDWNLEYQTGNLEIVNPFTVETLSHWDGKLATLTVTSSLDDGSAGTLRERIAAALAGDTVIFDMARTVTLGGTQIAWATNNLTIDGNGSTVSGNNASRVFNTTVTTTTFQNITITGGNAGVGSGGGINSQGSVTLNNSTVSGNLTTLWGGGINGVAVTLNNSTVSGNSSDGNGGGIYSEGAVTLTNSTVFGNSAGVNGGGIFSDGTVTLNNSTVSGNSANLDGGGIYTLGVVTLTNSTVSGNSANLNGGGIWSNGEVTLTNSTVFGNSATFAGGGIFSDRAVTLTNSTVFGNSANSGGGMLVTFEAVTLTNSTISGNSASSRGGGIESLGAVTLNNSTIAFNTAGTLGGGLSFSGNNPHSINNTINNTIIANNTAPTGPDVGIWSDTHTFNISHSLILNTSGMSANGSTGIPTNGVNGNIVGLDPNLGPLQNNGGPTQTHALLPGSPAINAGNNALAPTPIDQRGQPRISDLIVDMGAYELQVVPPVLPPEPLPENSEPLPENPPIPNLTSEGICFPNCEPEEPSEAAVESVEQLQTDTSEQSTLDIGVENIETQITQEYQDYLGVDPVPEMTLTEAQDMLQRIAKQTGQTPAILYITFVPTGLETSEDFTESLLASATLDDPFPLAQRSLSPAETDELQLVLVTPTGTPILKRLRVNRRQATVAISQLARAITRTSGRSYLQPAQELYNWLIAPLRLELTDYQIDHIGIIADTGLRFIPFAALHDGAQFLIEQYSVGLMPSLSLTEHTYQSIQGLPVLAMGASEFTAQAPLPAVPLELSMITEQIGTGEKLINEDFTLQQLRAARDRLPYPIIHLGTHGEFNPGSPADSYIELWGDRLTLDRIQELSLNNPPVELLVLSACRTALGSSEAELGFAGFAVQAGVKSVLGSLWYVSDAGTLGLMSAFYQQLQTAPIKAEALRQAQLAMAQGTVYLDGVNLVSGTQTVSLIPELAVLGRVDLSHPYYWSAFTMIGSPW